MNCIAIPFAYDEQKNTGVNVSKNNALITYLKNSMVAASSAKHYNPNDEVLFVTNIRYNNLPAFIIECLNKNGVNYKYFEFDRFTFSNDYKWCLAFYKLCVLSHLLSECDYEKVCYLDSDVYVQGSFEPVWHECDYNIMLYDIHHGLQINDYNTIVGEFSEFMGGYSPITHWGGEFVAVKKEFSAVFLDALNKVYNRMKEICFQTSKGDEFILSIAAYQCRQIVKNAGAYITREWSEERFRLITTNYKYNRVIVLHLPSEKERGMLKLYDRYISRGKFPKDEICWKICHLTTHDWLRYFKTRVDDFISFIRAKSM